MPWKECSAVSQRLEFVRLAQAPSRLAFVGGAVSA